VARPRWKAEEAAFNPGYEAWAVIAVRGFGALLPKLGDGVLAHGSVSFVSAPRSRISLACDNEGVEFPELDPETFDRIRHAVQRWASVHPSPEVPVLVMLDGSEMTPQDIADALELPDTPRGRTLYRMFSITVAGPEETRMPVDDIVTHFEFDIARWREALNG
jgi:hypothetical protein